LAFAGFQAAWAVLEYLKYMSLGATPLLACSAVILSICRSRQGDIQSLAFQSKTSGENAKHSQLDSGQAQGEHAGTIVRFIDLEMGNGAFS
jgi:hypothetical protein